MGHLPVPETRSSCSNEGSDHTSAACLFDGLYELETPAPEPVDLLVIAGRRFNIVVIESFGKSALHHGSHPTLHCIDIANEFGNTSRGTSRLLDRDLLDAWPVAATLKKGVAHLVQFSGELIECLGEYGDQSLLPSQAQADLLTTLFSWPCR